MRLRFGNITQNKDQRKDIIKDIWNKTEANLCWKLIKSMKREQNVIVEK